MSSSTVSSVLVGQVRQALVHARAATSADHKGEITTALSHYKDAIAILEAESSKPHKIPDDYLTQMADRAAIYQARVDLLEQELANLMPEKFSSPKEVFTFSEETPDYALPDPPPTSVLYKPYWLMRVWRATMVQGGYVTPKLYIPKSLWYQYGCKFAALQTKVQSCEAILEVLMKLRECGKDRHDVLERELDGCCAQLDVVQNSLHFHLSFIAEVKKKDDKDPTWGARMKKFGGALAKGAVRLAPSQRDEGSDYILLLKSLFDDCQFLEDWIAHFLKVNNPALNARLRRVSEFFLEVVCQFVLKDFNVLVDRYIKKNVETFVKLK